MTYKEKVFEAFHADHAALGQALHELRTLLAAGETKKAQLCAAKLNRTAGAHIAFEENDFYPALKHALSESEIEAMYNEHADGLSVIQGISDAETSQLANPLVKADFLLRIEALQGHVAECGDLFGAMGALTEEEFKVLYGQIEYWRKQAPHWTIIAAPDTLKGRARDA